MTDGTKIAERWAKMYKRLLGDPYADYAICDLIEELSRSEERERVLREALENLRGAFVVVCAPTDPNSYACYREAKTALSTPAPEQPDQVNG